MQRRLASDGQCQVLLVEHAKAAAENQKNPREDDKDATAPARGPAAKRSSRPHRSHGSLAAHPSESHPAHARESHASHAWEPSHASWRASSLIAGVAGAAAEIAATAE